jgi:ferredoxin-type protein NapF
LNGPVTIDRQSTATEGRTGRRLRLGTRCAALLATAILLWLPVPDGWLTTIPVAVSPLVAVSSAVAVRALTATALVGLPVLLVILIRRRWFCRWACPTGLLTEWAGRVRPLDRSARPPLRWPLLGPWVAVITLAGACLGYPLLVWLDPLALLAGCLGAVCRPAAGWGWLYALGLPVVLLVSGFWPGVWCRKLCPLGATQDLVALQTGERPGVSRPVETANGAATVGLTPPRSPVGSSGRRAVLAAGLGAVWAALTLRRARSDSRRPLRPPSAIDEAAFTGVCLRCGNCVRACPTHILQPDLGTYGIASFLTPAVQFAHGYCREDCCRCTEVCPSGAITRLRLEQKPQVRIGLPRVDMALCLLGDDRECAACRSGCPYEAIAYVFNEEDYTTVPRIDAARCNGCGACQLYCPTTPVKAIAVHAPV